MVIEGAERVVEDDKRLFLAVKRIDQRKAQTKCDQGFITHTVTVGFVHSALAAKLDEALDLFSLPRTLGQFEEMPVVVNTGRFGPYVQLGKQYVSLPAGTDPMLITFEEAVALIEKKRQFEQQRQIKIFAENPDVEILNGRYGPYIAMGGKNYKIPTGTDPASLDLAACMEIIEKAADKPASPRRRKK